MFSSGLICVFSVVVSDWSVQKPQVQERRWMCPAGDHMALQMPPWLDWTLLWYPGRVLQERCREKGWARYSSKYHCLCAWIYLISNVSVCFRCLSRTGMSTWWPVCGHREFTWMFVPTRLGWQLLWERNRWMFVQSLQKWRNLWRLPRWLQLPGKGGLTLESNVNVNTGKYQHCHTTV